MTYRPETARRAQRARRRAAARSALVDARRAELIATCVSARNGCQYCQTIHGAVAAHHPVAMRTRGSHQGWIRNVPPSRQSSRLC
jgi:AhpD family alkylhydroperoxidase